MVNQLTYPMFLSKKVYKYLLILHARLSPPTWLNPTITEYNTLLHVVLEGPYNRVAIDCKPHWELSFNVRLRAIETNERRCSSAFERNVLRSIALTKSDFPETKTNT